MNDRVPRSGLDAQGIATGAEIFWNLTTAPLVEHAVRRGLWSGANWRLQPASLSG